jgi:glutamate formiminotransferase
MTQLVQCVPNFSEGRNVDVVRAIVAAVEDTPRVRLLDYSYDYDHNRSVVTFAGGLKEVGEAAFRAAARAAELIDMSRHSGGHPRMGATDVIPFIPVSGVTMNDCVQLARTVGERIGNELDIPVYLYEEAAGRPERRNLADVRRGEYEALQEKLKDERHVPDFGPARFNPLAGATAVGARRPLVAYNVNLHTSDINLAKKIANAVRERSGGLTNVKAMGLLLEERQQVQISMNLVNCDATPVYRVVELIRAEAARYGVSVANTEVVGLIPMKYLVDCAAYYLQLDGFSADQVLEQKIFFKG